ncbi:hypothetical protein AAVH_43188, partial [Aphelenchoides avenae]
MCPEISRTFEEASQKHRTARLVVEQTRAEHGTRVPSKDNESKDRHVHLSPSSTQTGSTDDGRPEDLKLRLERLESLVVKRVDKSFIAE